MKKLGIGLAIVLATILLAAGVTYAKAVYDYNTKPKAVISKYDVGPPDPAEMLELINAERAKVGVAPMQNSPEVAQASQIKADDFSTRHYYSHTVLGMPEGITLNDEMTRLIRSKCSYSSENIINNTVTSRDAVTGWMHSLPHKKAILDPKYNLTGLGVSVDDHGYYFAVEHFCVSK